MPSPFPGMDPYLEDKTFWHDFHQSLTTAIRTQLVSWLRPKYRATIDTSIVYESSDDYKIYTMRPDITVLREDYQEYQTAGVAIAPAPLIQEVELEIEWRLRTINIYTMANKQLVTCIELLSPANKVTRGRAYHQYQRKRNRLWNSPVHIMELDLLRAGERIILGEKLPPASYYATLSRAEKRPEVEIWPMFVGEPLPVLPVPLLPPDPDVPLDLNPIISTVYDNAGYDYAVDYHEPIPPPSLSEAEQARVDEILAQHADELSHTPNGEVI